jgi:uncharacterized protein (DUF433 family)
MEPLEKTQVVPLMMRQDGTVHVTGSRVTLDTIVAFYQAGESAEGIHEGFPTLTLAQIHGVLQYYHEHREEVEAYLHRRGEQARELQRRLNAQFPDRLKAELHTIQAGRRGVVRSSGFSRSGLSDSLIVRFAQKTKDKGQRSTANGRQWTRIGSEEEQQSSFCPHVSARAASDFRDTFSGDCLTWRLVVR